MTWIAGVHGPFWTEDRIELLTDGFNAGLSFSVIAKKIGNGCTRNAAIGKAQRLGLRRGHPSPPGKPRKVKSPPSLRAAIQNLANRSPDRPLPPEKPNTFASTPKPWTERALGECAYPLGEGADLLSCCNPAPKTANWNYCAEHMKLMTSKPATDAQRKAAAKARLAKAKAMRRAA